MTLYIIICHFLLYTRLKNTHQNERRKFAYKERKKRQFNLQNMFLVYMINNTFESLM